MNTNSRIKPNADQVKSDLMNVKVTVTYIDFNDEYFNKASINEVERDPDKIKLVSSIDLTTEGRRLYQTSSVMIVRYRLYRILLKSIY